MRGSVRLPCRRGRGTGGRGETGRGGRWGDDAFEDAVPASCSGQMGWASAAGTSLEHIGSPPPQLFSSCLFIPSRLCIFPSFFHLLGFLWCQLSLGFLSFLLPYLDFTRCSFCTSVHWCWSPRVPS